MAANAFVELLRPANCVMAAIAVLIGHSLVVGSFDFQIEVWLAMASAFLICGGGQAINDYYDRAIDAKIKPKRPIPSGRISPRTAFWYSAALFIVGVALGGLVNFTAFIIALVVAVLLFLYSASLSRFKWAGNFLVAAATGLTFVYGATITGQQSPGLVYDISRQYLAPGLLGLAAFFSNLAREWSKDLEDVAGDVGRKRTLPIIVGKRVTISLAIVALAFAFIAGFAPFYLGLLQNSIALGIIVLSVVVFGLSGFRLAKRDYKGAQSWAKRAMLVALLAYVVELLL